MQVGRRINRESFFFQANLFRFLCLVVIVFGWILNVATIDTSIVWFWHEVCLKSVIFKHDSFEPSLSVICFGLNIGFWVIVDFYGPSYLHRYRISQDDSLAAWKGREMALTQETVWYIAPWILIDIFFPRRKLPRTAPTSIQILMDVFLAMVAYDFFFFVGHSAMHKYKSLYRNYHAKHHHAKTIRACDSIRHTFVDGTFDVLCSVASLNLLKAHPLSRAIFNVTVITLITEAHCGTNFPCGLHNIIPIFAGPVVHDLHHSKSTVNYQKFFKHLDWLQGTLQTEVQQPAPFPKD